MTRIIFLECSYTIVEGIHKKDDLMYCYKPCSTGSVSCECRCCHPVEEWEKGR